MNVQLIMAGVVMDARIFKDATSAPALSDLSWIERKRTAKVFSFFPSLIYRSAQNSKGMFGI